MTLLRACLFLTVLLPTFGCATLTTRFPSNVAAGFAEGPMRRMETRSLRIYYPEERQADVLRMAARLEACVDLLTAKAGTGRDRVDVFVTRSNFNNAYVQPLAPGLPELMVLPGNVTIELFNWFQLGPGEVRNIACHEAVHYVQLQQVDGLINVLNAITGGLLQPNVFTESWFLEGLATWYEGHLGERTGRPYSPVFRGYWLSGVASEGGRIDAGYLQGAHRKVVPFGGSYQTGYFFVDWLVRTHGEEKLWQLVRNVGRGITLNVGISLRFKAVYGRDLGGLFRDFTKSLQALPVRTRPDSQKVLARDLGYAVRLASASDGTLALLTQSRTEVPTLRVLSPDGKERFARWIKPLIPERRFIDASPLSFSGLRFSPDGTSLYAFLSDLDVDGNESSKLLRFDARDGSLLQIWDGLMGMGGDLTPDGKSYVFVEVRGDSSQLTRLDLQTGARTQLTRFGPTTSLAPPSVSPDGKRIVFPRMSDGGYALWLLEEGREPRQLTPGGGFDYAPRWLDARRMVFMHEVEGRSQVALMDVDEGALQLASDAPYLALDPVPAAGGRIAFLNRDAWTFSLDEVRIPPAAPAAPVAPSGDEAALDRGASRASGADQRSPGRSPEPSQEEEVDASGDPPAAPEREQSREPSQEQSQELQPPPAPDGPAPMPPAPASDPGLVPSAPAPIDGASGSGAAHQPPAGPAPSLLLAPPPARALSEAIEDGLPPLQVLSDAPYSPLDGLFYPQLRTPYLAALSSSSDGTGPGGVDAVVGASLQGADRLGRHNWAINAYYDTAQRDVGGSLGYANHQLAPWVLSATLTRTPSDPRLDWTMRLAASRAFWSTPVSFSVLGFQRDGVATEGGPWRLRLVGPRVATEYFAGDSTLDGGLQRGVGVSFAAALYAAHQQGPGNDTGSLTIGDVRVGVNLGVPLPLLGTDSFLLTFTARTLPDAPMGLLRVGGSPAAFSNLDFDLPPTQVDAPYPVLGPLAFYEPVRGYEDRELAATRFAHAHARYRQSLIIDYGWTNFLWLFPSFFVRQVDLDAFASVFGTDGARPLHRVAGASLQLRTVFGGALPVSVGYQFAYRWDDGLEPLHLFMFSL